MPTPTSATGRPEAGAGPAAGFTLVELMVVLAIIGLVSAAVVMTVPTGGSLATEAERLAARMDRAHEEAILSGRPVAAVIDRQGYGFEVAREGVWQPLPGRLFAREAWGPGTQVVLADEQGSMRVAFDPTGHATAANVLLAREDERAQVSVSGTGKVAIGAGAS